MEVKKLRAVVTVAVVMGMLMGQSCASFQDCYAKCFFFCMIDPAQTLCGCTTSCLKSCIFPGGGGGNHPQSINHEDTNNLNFCKLGCALSLCSGLSSKQNPNAEKLGGCVGSCSKMCTKSYSSSP